MFGFGDKKIEIQMDKFNFKPGDTVEGTVALTVKKATKAKGVFVTLYADERSSGARGNRSRNRVYELKQQLDGEKEYNTGETPAVYPFRIKIPTDVLKEQKLGLEGHAATAMKAVQFLAGGMRQLRWYVEGKLDISMGLDTSKKIQVNISE